MCIRDSMGVEFRSVDACELGLSPDLNSTTAAHAGAIDHDRVERRDRLDLIGPRDLCDRRHHRDGPDREYDGDVLVGDDIDERLRDEALPAVRAIVGARDHFDTVTPELVLEEDVLLRPASDDGDDPISFGGEGAGYRVRDRGSDAAPDHDRDSCIPVDFGGAPEGPGNIDETVTRLQLAQQHRGAADCLDEERDRPCLRVGFGDRQRNPLAVRCHPNDDELTGPVPVSYTHLTLPTILRV